MGQINLVQEAIPFIIRERGSFTLVSEAFSMTTRSSPARRGFNTISGAFGGFLFGLPQLSFLG